MASGAANDDEFRNGAVDLAHEDAIRLGPLMVEPGLRRIGHADGREEFLEPRVMQVLVALLRADGAILSREDLIHRCWEDRVVGDDSINRVMFRLRRITEGIGAGIFQIETIKKVGYRLKAKERRRDPTAAAAPLFRRWRVAGLFAGLVGLAIAGATLSGGIGAASTEQSPSLAVLPFADLSPDRDHEYFAEGVAEEIVGLLSEEPTINVTGRTSVKMLGDEPDFREVRRRLRATHVLEGSVRKAGDRLRIHVRLLETQGGTQLWSESFDRQVGDVFAVQDSVAAAVLVKLHGTLAEPRREARTFRTSPQVYDLYLTANQVARERSFEAMSRARKLLFRAVELDPDYAPAYARIAFYSAVIDQLRPEGDFLDGPQEKRRARTYALRAIQLAPNLAEAHATIGMLEWREAPERALAHHRQAIALDPGNYLAWNNGGNALNGLCRPREAVEFYTRAKAIEPLLRTPHFNLIRTLEALGRHEEAESHRREFLRLSASPVDSHALVAEHALARGDFSGAVAQGIRVVDLGSDVPYFRVALADSLYALGLADQAGEYVPEAFRALFRAYWKGDHNAAGKAALKLDHRLWGDGARAHAGSNALLRAGLHGPLVASFYDRFGTIEEFDRHLRCGLPAQVAPIVIALRRQGRAVDAARLLRLAATRYGEAMRAGYTGFEWDVARAQLLLLSGRRNEALAALDQAVQRGWAGQATEATLSDPIFDPIRQNPRFLAILKRHHQVLTRELSELERELAERETGSRPAA